MRIEMKDILPDQLISKLPLSFQRMHPIDKQYAVFIDRMITIKKYQTERCAVYPYHKPISKII